MQNRENNRGAYTKMDGFKKLGEQELITLKKMRRRFLAELAKIPEGTLGTNNSNGKTYLRWWKKGKKPKHLSRKRPEDMKLAAALRRKMFLKEMVAVIENNIDALEEFLPKYVDLDPKGISDRLAKTYKLVPGEELEVSMGFAPHPAAAVDYKSKSEQIIALVLESNGLEFQYECEIIANRIVYKPDFTIRVPDTNETVYFEHFGIPDHEGYYEEMVRKLINYWHEGIRIGKNLIVTFETEAEPLTAAQVQLALDQFFGTSKQTA